MKADDIKLIGVMGGGVMGGGIAQTCAVAGFDVRIRDMNDDLLEKTRQTVVEGRFGLRGAVERQKLTQQQMDAALERLSFTTSDQDLRDADLVIEAVPEDLDLKKKVFAELDSLIKPEAVFASNTSGFAISDLNKAVARKDRFIGMHWFSPAFVMRLVEIIYAPETSEDTIQLLEQVGARLGKETIRVKDAPRAYGFVANRIYFAAVAEARKVAEEDIASVDDINKAMRFGFNWPSGPLELAAGARKGWQ
ncbi:MAG: 3-hydroxyacyl-CoA dehydrogenase family protein [Dehalococcoidia bacterium]|nr:3-hydroxyacyl-CoA dehydrogenase family protein [Dehalococcoidia bacterium]